MEITVYGTGTSGTQLVKTTLESFLKKAEIDFSIEEVHDVNEFMKMMIQSIPAVIIDGKEKYELKQNGKFNASLRNLVQKLLKRENYGKMPKIIVPTDFSETSVNSFNFATRYAKDISGMVKVVHVYYPSSADINGNVFVDVGLKKVKEALLDEFVEVANQDWIGELMATALIDKQFAEGFPVPKILDISKENQASYIIVGTTGEGETFKKWFGSVSTELVKKSDIPIIVVPPESRYTGFGKILYASNDPLLDEHCLEFLCNFSKSHGSILHVVHVAQPGEETSDFISHWMDINCPDVEYINKVIHHEDVEEGLHDYARGNKIDLVIMSSKKRSFLENIFHSSVSKKMAMHTDIPIMVLHGHNL